MRYRKKFFTERVVRHWHRPHRETVDVPSQGAFKARWMGRWATCSGEK